MAAHHLLSRFSSTRLPALISVIFDGNHHAKRVLEDIRLDISTFSSRVSSHRYRAPGLGILLIGNHPASMSYVQRKRKVCDAIGVHHEVVKLSSDVSEEVILDAIESLNQNDRVDGIITQLPLPSHVSLSRVISTISWEKDADGLKQCVWSCGGDTSTNQSAAIQFLPSTPSACMKILEDSEVQLHGKHVVLIGRGTLVGSPLEIILRSRRLASLTICDKSNSMSSIQLAVEKVLTPSLKIIQAARSIQGGGGMVLIFKGSAFEFDADVVISAAGERHLIKGAWIKPGAAVLDVGVSKAISGIDRSRVVGDVEFDEAWKRASLITPVPGGIGPLTAAMLLQNTVQLWKTRMNSALIEDEIEAQEESYYFDSLSPFIWSPRPQLAFAS